MNLQVCSLSSEGIDHWIIQNMFSHYQIAKNHIGNKTFQILTTKVKFTQMY